MGEILNTSNSGEIRISSSEIGNKSPLPENFQDLVFEAIAVQRPLVTQYIKEVRRGKPSAAPADIMKTIEARYVATTTLTSAAVGATSAVPAVGVPVAIGLGVADLLFFYETTALFALSMAELRGIEINDRERAKALVLGAILGEKRQNDLVKMIMAALPAGTSISSARAAAGAAVKIGTPKWGELLAENIPDSALVPVSIVLARQAIAQGTVLGTVKIGSKTLGVIGAFAGGATSYWFGSGIVKSCREGFSEPLSNWPKWLELEDSDNDGVRDPSRAVLALREAAYSAKDFSENVWSKVVDSTEAFRRVDLDGDGIKDEPRVLTAIKNFANKASKTLRRKG